MYSSSYGKHQLPIPASPRLILTEPKYRQSYISQANAVLQTWSKKSYPSVLLVEQQAERRT
jgi:hypothetical protein